MLDHARGGAHVVVLEGCVAEAVAEGEGGLDFFGVVVAIADVDAFVVGDLEVFAGIVAVGGVVLVALGERDRQLARGVGVAEEDRGECMAALLAAVPHVDESRSFVEPGGHGDRIACVEHDDGTGIGLLDGFDQSVLAGGQIHGCYIEALAFVFVVAADHDDGDVSVRCRVNCLLEVSGAGLGCVVGEVFAVHAGAERVGDGDAAAGFLLDSIERGHGVFGADERAAAAAGAGYGGIGSR